MKKIFTLWFLHVLFVLNINAQVNGYANVTGILGPVLTVTASDETYDQFNIGDKVIIMQMKDNVIGSNTSNNNSFGNLSSIAQAGQFEAATVLAVVRTGLLPTSITLTASLSNTYNTGNNSSVQIITYPTLGTGGYTTTSNITAVPWNGSIGGVVAFSVTGILTLNHNISASEAGFRGGVADASSSPYGSCNSSTFFNAVHAYYGNKGEGIYNVTNANYAAGKGKIINGGGGGNTINAGGGGGGNYTAGGNGFYGWSCSNGSGGIRGIALNSHVTGDRFFMGGGGGSGESNDNSNDKGGNGGGIIIIQAQIIRTTGSGTPVTISANGQNGNNVANDGAGGGGAGGSILLLVNNWNVAATKLLNISANGGNGGDVVNGAQHGGGGGGGQGAVLFSSPVPSTNITATTTSGIGGLNFTGGTRAASGVGAVNTGVIGSISSALPLKLISFTASKNNDLVRLQWKTQNEVNVSHFEIQRSTDGITFETIGNTNAIGNSQATQTYSFNDPQAVRAVTYYRLRMVDVDSKFTFSNTLVIRAGNINGVDVSIYPNPAVTSAAVYIKSDVTGTAAIRVMNMQGATIIAQQNMISKGENTVLLNRVAELSAGVYNVQVTINNKPQYTRLIVQK